MQPLIAVLGPTATGKTSLGMRLAQELDGEIINADALQVYRGLEIGTDKPPPELRRAVPHHLIDILDPEEPYSAGEFARRARPLIDDIRRRRRTPILVGGSGLYLRAVLEGLSPIPPTDPEVRAALEARCASDGLAALYQELRGVDPATARRLTPGDRQRILRALEVARSSGRPLSGWLAERPQGGERSSAVKLGLTLPRTILYDRIASRVTDMLERGWVEEVKTLLQAGVDPRSPAFQAIGYRQLARHVQGGWDLEAARDDTIRATRRYAKRQMTWFRKEEQVRWIPAAEPERGIRSWLRQFKRGGSVAR
jgi:tRNA dimethylallyltransferase